MLFKSVVLSVSTQYYSELGTVRAVHVDVVVSHLSQLIVYSQPSTLPALPVGISLVIPAESPIKT